MIVVNLSPIVLAVALSILARKFGKGHDSNGIQNRTVFIWSPTNLLFSCVSQTKHPQYVYTVLGTVS